MRRTLILALIVLVLSVALCAVSTLAMGRAVGRAEALRLSAERAARLGDADGALSQMRALEANWREDGRWLELVTSHDALSDVRGGIADALLCLEAGNRTEFLRASAAVAAALERLRATEAVRMMNLF